MFIYKFCYRTAFSREVDYFKGVNYSDAYKQYLSMTKNRMPHKCILDIVWKCDENAEPIERLFYRN